MNAPCRAQSLVTLLIALAAVLPSLHATKVAGGIDTENGLTVSLLPDPAGRAAVVVSNVAGARVSPLTNNGKISGDPYNSTPTAPQTTGGYYQTLDTAPQPPGGEGSNFLPGGVHQFTDSTTGKSVILAVQQPGSSPSGHTTVSALQGRVTLNLPGGTQLRLDAGSGAVVDSSGRASQQTIAQIVAAEKAANNGNSTMATYLQQAVQMVAADVAGHTLSGDAAIRQLAAIVKLAVQADPAQAASFVSAAVAAIGASGNANAVTAISTVVVAAIQGNADVKDTVLSAATAAARQANIGFNETVLNQQTGAVNQIVTPPVYLDVSIRSASGE